MKFYKELRPEVDQVTMCTVTEYNEGIGFSIQLDEYNQEGFLMLVELHNKKIRVPFSSFLKVGTRLPLLVLDSGSEDSQAYLSKKGVKQNQIKECKLRFQLNNRLSNLSKRLPVVEGSNWLLTFIEINDPECEDETQHPWTSIQTREWSHLKGLNCEQLKVLKDNHAKLFGIKPQSVRLVFSLYSFAIEGNASVRDSLISVRDKWSKDGKDSYTNDELYIDNQLCNIYIQPIAIPSFQLKVTAYNRQRCYDILEQIKKDLTLCDMDHIQFQDVENL